MEASRKSAKATVMRLWHRLMRLGSRIFGQTALSHLVEEHDVPWLIAKGVLAATVITSPIVLAWIAFCYIFGMAFDWRVRATLLWILVITVSVLGGLTDEVTKQRRVRRHPHKKRSF